MFSVRMETGLYSLFCATFVAMLLLVMSIVACFSVSHHFIMTLNGRLSGLITSSNGSSYNDEKLKVTSLNRSLTLEVPFTNSFYSLSISSEKSWTSCSILF